MKIDRKTFFDGVREFLENLEPDSVELTQERVDALEFLVTSFEKHRAWKDIRHIAYALSTIAHETAWTFRPIKEYRARAGSKGRANQDRYWLTGFYGRGYVQLTWKRNYQLFGIADEPDKALQPETAFFILTKGMHEGLFTGRKLTDYISDTGKDYKNARKIINGTDKAALIAGYANQFEEILRASKVSSAVPQLSPHKESDTSTQGKPSDTPQTDWTEGERPQTETNVNIDNAENVNVENKPPPSGHPVKVTVERVSIWSKVGMGIAAIAGVGINFGNLVTTRLNEMTLPQLGYVLGGVAIIAVGLWLYDRAARRAHEKTLVKMATASDPSQNTVELREQTTIKR